MSETETKAKTYTELEQEYSQLAFRAGHIQYEVTQKQKEVDLLLSAMRDVSIEGAKAKARETEAAAASTETKKDA